MLGRLLGDLWKHGIAATLKPSGGSEQPAVIPLDDINCLVKGRHGWFLANRYDVYLGRALIVYGEYAELEHEFLRSLLHPGDCVVEVGANIGSHTVGLARAVGPSGSVVAIEPQPAIFRVLCANLALNGLANVSPLAVGCAARRGTMTIPPVDYHSPVNHNSGGVSLGETEKGVPVDVLPLDQLLDVDRKVQLLKIDVEGMEKDVLEGASRLVERHRPLLYVENDRIDESQALIEWIMHADYRLWWHTPALFNPSNFFGVSDNLFTNIASINMLGVPKRMALRATDRLQELTEPTYHLLRR